MYNKNYPFRIYMIEKIGHIKNPLTVIAMFAGIAEVSGSAVLPFIASENQKLYIYFLMCFPILLIILFLLLFGRSTMFCMRHQIIKMKKISVS